MTAPTGGRQQFSRFALAGSLGFAVDASVLTVLVNGLDYGHYESRAVSFALAVTVTWLVNRRWVFAAGAPTGQEFSGYVLVQSIGALTNLGLYVLLIELIPRLAKIPALPLAGCAVVALSVNFVLARRFVFRHRVAGDSR